MSGLNSTVGDQEARTIFISHAHADRVLAGCLGTLITDAFSEVLRAFFSSDPSPAGGLMPGEEWFGQIEFQLRRAEAVWVLATPTSIARPWLYWEAGLGRALCPAGIVVLRVGLAVEEIPSPLNAYLSYDALSSRETGIVDLLGRAGRSVGMKVAPAWLDVCALNFIERAKLQVAGAGDSSTTAKPALSPERLDRMEALLVRLEASVDSVAGLRSDSGRLARGATSGSNRDLLAGMLAGRAMGAPSLQECLAAIDGAPAESVFTPMSIDATGDLVVAVQNPNVSMRVARMIVAGVGTTTLPVVEGLTPRGAAFLDSVAALQRLAREP